MFLPIIFCSSAILNEKISFLFPAWFTEKTGLGVFSFLQHLLEISLRLVYNARKERGGDSLNIQQLKGFICVAQTRNITKAAFQMHLTQQALSKSIGKLEEELGVSLFVRSDRQTVLTDIGQKLLPVAQSLLQKHEEHEKLMREIIEQNSHMVKIAFENTVLLNGFPADLLSRIGDMTITAYLGADNASCIKDVLECRATCAFVLKPQDLKGLEYFPIVKHYPDVIMSKKHPLMKKKTIAIEDLRNENHAWLSINSLSFQDYYNACIDAGFYPKITKEFPTAELLHQAIPYGMEITVGGGFFFFNEENLGRRPLVNDSCMIEAGFVYRPFDEKDRNLISYFRVVRDTIDSL